MPPAAESQLKFSPYQFSEEDRKKMRIDQQTFKEIAEYKRPYQQIMVEGVSLYNMRPKPMADKRVSNVIIPLVRMVADACNTNMNAGLPSFNVKPRDLSDYPKSNIIKPALEGILSDCNYQFEQGTFLKHGTVQGTAAFEVYTQLPQMMDEGRPVRDWSRPRIGVRARSGMEVGFHPSRRNHNDGGIDTWRDRISKSAFDQDYKIVQLSNGQRKYRNTDAVKPGRYSTIGEDGIVYERAAGMYEHKGVTIEHIQDPINNFYRIYANGVMIYDVPLKMKRNPDGTHKIGDNAVGKTRLCVWTNNDLYDDNNSDIGLYGVPESYLIRGLNDIYQSFTNMMVDNWRLSQTFALSYKPNGVDAFLPDLDSTDFYSGMFIQGEIIRTAFGEVNLNDFEVVKNTIDEWCVYVTQCNWKQIVGEAGTTAFEVAQRIRAQNKGFEQKIAKMENMVFKKMGTLLVGAMFTEMTVDDFDVVTDSNREQVLEMLEAGKISVDDLITTDVEGKATVTAKRIKQMIKIPGKVYVEKLGTDKKRILDGSVKSTLTEDISKEGKADSFIPADAEYLHTKEYIDHGQIPFVTVETGRMLAGMKDLQAADMAQLTGYAATRWQMQAADQTGAMETEFDPKKFDDRMMELYNQTPEGVMKDTGDDQEQKEELDKLDDQIGQFEAMMNTPANALSSPLSNGTQSVQAPVSQTAAPVSAGPAPAMAA